MKTLRSYVLDAWHEASGGFVDLVDPSTEEVVARASSRGIDFGAALAHAHAAGGPALRALSFAERGQMLKAISGVLRDNRDELLDLSRLNNGTTTSDGTFDIDGATGVLAYYAALSRELGDSFIAEDEIIQVGKGDGFCSRHFLLPRDGVALHVNAFNFPAWGFAEKAACALLAGMPVITKPATATALVTARCVEIIVGSGILPAGALQFICGSTGDLLDRLGPQDVIAFTGSAHTARTLRSRAPLQKENTRFNVEADSLNAAVLAPGVEDATFALFIREVAREITHKAGQKCTAIRRILVPADAMDSVQDALAERLGRTITGNPVDPEVRMGPLATRSQLDDALEGVAALGREARIIVGDGRRTDGRGSPEGRGYFLAPTLLRTNDARTAVEAHRREVFGPVATLMPYDGSPDDAAVIAALGGGMLVTSVYADDNEWLSRFLVRGGAWSGRVYVGSSASASEAPGPGAAWPHSQHGGPGRAGDGAELGGQLGLRLYLQRVALQGARKMLEAVGNTSGK
jgi:oxepin-CoA hydrolase/3-oxo-5,6-dehydrosuberyl-CoA semialdehyde dehydrogenase